MNKETQTILLDLQLPPMSECPKVLQDCLYPVEAGDQVVVVPPVDKLAYKFIGNYHMPEHMNKIINLGIISPIYVDLTNAPKTEDTTCSG